RFQSQRDQRQGSRCWWRSRRSRSTTRSWARFESSPRATKRCSESLHGPRSRQRGAWGHGSVARTLGRQRTAGKAAPRSPRQRGPIMMDVDGSPVRWWRLALLASLVVVALLVARATGLNGYLSAERIRTVTAAAGLWGPLVFVLLFCAGELLHVPGA